MSVGKFIEKYQLVLAVIGLLGLGGAGALYAKKFVTHDDLASRDAARKTLLTDVAIVAKSQEVLAERVKALQDSNQAIREDLKTLLQSVLANPPRRKK